MQLIVCPCPYRCVPRIVLLDEFVREVPMFRSALWLLLIPAAFAQVHEHGPFLKKKEKIKGSYTLVEENGRWILRFSEDFATKNGPDLQIVFSPKPFDAVNGKNALADGAVSIGLLTSNKGAQEYVLPEDLDLTHMKCILIHCVKYTRLWGGAPL